MKRRFKSKRHKKNKNFIFIILLIISFFLISKLIVKKINIDKINEISIFNFDRSKLLLRAGLNFKEIVNKIDKPIIPVNAEVIIKPKIYLYNTHNTEEYIGGNIMDATRILKNKLSNKVDVIYDEINVVGMLDEKKYNYNQAYLITKELVRNNLNDSIGLYIDVHRDAVKKNISTVVIDGVSYAKILFVVGALHDNYKSNYEVCDKLNKKIKNFNPDLSRGILVRENARYNQELNSNVILIELGGNENTMEEINNTINILSSVIEEYLYE